MNALVYQNQDTLYVTTNSKHYNFNKRKIDYISHKRDEDYYLVTVAIGEHLFPFDNEESSSNYVPLEYLLKITM